MKYNGVIQRKLALLDDQVLRLKSHTSGADAASFAEDWALRSMTERAVQVAAEIMIDICERIIALEGAGPVASAADAVEKLVELRVLASSEPYRSIVRFRNLIVHEYEAINPAMLHEIVSSRLDDFLLFRREIDSAG